MADEVHPGIRLTSVMHRSSRRMGPISEQTSSATLEPFTRHCTASVPASAAALQRTNACTNPEISETLSPITRIVSYPLTATFCSYVSELCEIAPESPSHDIPGFQASDSLNSKIQRMGTTHKVLAPIVT